MHPRFSQMRLYILTVSDVTADGTIYSNGHSAVEFKGNSVTVPMLGVFSLIDEGPEKGKIKYMALYKDRVPARNMMGASLGLGSNNT